LSPDQKNLEPVVTNGNIEVVPSQLVHKELDAVSERELQILQFLAAGMLDKSIAGSLFVNDPTVKFHLRNTKPNCTPETVRMRCLLDGSLV
jgi:ATP/maltotriose-dependent transcriptional regulator MalT